MLRSRRLGHELRWRQSARADRSARNAIRRTARLDQHDTPLDGAPEAITELEYQHAVVPPGGLSSPNIPGYFRVPAGRIRLGVSVRTHRGRLDLRTPGNFYYPIGASRSRTGFGFSISAPFEMNEDRSQLVDPQNSGWNAWLLQESAAFAIRLLPEQLFAAFGPEAFLAFDPQAADAYTVPALNEEIGRLLRTEPCWPTQATTGRSKRPVDAPVGSLAIPVSPALADFTANTFGPEDLLRGSIATRPDTRVIAAALGGKVFTVSSLFRLHCAGADSRSLATKLDDTKVSNYHFTDFPDDLLDLVMQQRFAAALDACRADLSDDHKKDLRTTATTMTASGTLAPLNSLWIVDEALAALVSKDRTLHPALVGSKVLSGLCRPFNFSRWAIETAGRLTAGTASDEERDALARYIRGLPALSQKAWAALRRAPVLPDHRSAWTAPADMVSRSAPGASLLESALHLPTRADEANESLRHLRFRSAVRGRDLVALAKLVEQGAVPPTVMSRAAGRLHRMFTPSVLDQLKSIKFVETEQGTVTAPADAYVRSDRVVAVLGEDAPYAAAGLPVSLLQRLGCRTEPRADDILTALGTLRAADRSVSRPEIVYRALVAALRRERRPTGQLRDEPIIWTGGRWEAPGECLLGADNRSAFLDAVTVLPEALHDVWVFLGAHQRPTEAHWRRLLVRAGELYGMRQVPRRVAEALRRAYRHLDGLPEGLSPGTRCLLDDQHSLHSPSEAAAGSFLINDNPALASAVLAAHVPVAFADTADPRVIQFLDAAGARPLSASAPLVGTEYSLRTSPADTPHTDGTLARLHNPNFASAIATLVSNVSGPDRSPTAASLTARLARITRIIIVDAIRRGYKVAGHDVTVAADYDVGDDQIVLDRVAGSYELRRAVATAVAILADPGRLGEQVLGDAVYFLLRCRSAREIQRELERSKVAWRPGIALDTDDAEDADDEDVASLADAIGRKVVQEALTGRSVTPGTQQMSPPSPARTPRPPLPELRDVRPRPTAVTSAPSQRHGAGSGGGGFSSWAPPNYQESEDDRAVGRRGEEIVLDIERERVSRLGLSPDRVIWTADSVPGADHDIKSVDDDGSDLWVEVKSTTGRDGKFGWPVAEFRLAVRARQRYVLYRVYEADTTVPSYRQIRDPIGFFDAGELRLDLDRLTGDIGALAASTDRDAPPGT